MRYLFIYIFFGISFFGISQTQDLKDMDIVDYVDGKVFECENLNDFNFTYLNFDVENKELFKLNSNSREYLGIDFSKSSPLKWTKASGNTGMKSLCCDNEGRVMGTWYIGTIKSSDNYAFSYDGLATDVGLQIRYDKVNKPQLRYCKVLEHDVTLYYDKEWKSCRKPEATFYRKFTRNPLVSNVSKEITDYYITGELQGKSTAYLIASDDKDSKFVGLSQGYYKSGNKHFEQFYDKNSKVFFYFVYDESGDLTRSGVDSNNLNLYKTLSPVIKVLVEKEINPWLKKGEFEKTIDFQKRVNEANRDTKIKSIQKNVINDLKKSFIEIINPKLIKLKEYDADNETFLLSSNQLGEFVLPVPINEAQEFKKNFSNYKYFNPDFKIHNNSFQISHLELKSEYGKKYVYNIKNNSSYTKINIDYNFSKIEIDLPKNTVSSNSVTQTSTISVGKSDVDVNVPVVSNKYDYRYALVIGNEDYSSKQTNLSTEQDVEFARNDAISFKNYMTSTLGFREDHVTLLTDATGGMINRETTKLIQLAKLDPKSEIVFYYAGHGLPNDDKNPYLLPVDVSTINLKEDGLALKELYSKLASSNAAKITVFLDACFSGGGRDQGLLAARGVKIKPKEEAFTGNMVVFASSSGEERSLPYEQKQHGMFTYFLLKKLQETKGNATYSELSEYVKKEVSRSSLLKKFLQQTPHTNISPSVQSSWQTWSFR